MSGLTANPSSHANWIILSSEMFSSWPEVSLKVFLLLTFLNQLMSILSTDKIENRSFSRQGVVSAQWSREQKHSCGMEGFSLQNITWTQTTVFFLRFYTRKEKESLATRPRPRLPHMRITSRTLAADWKLLLIKLPLYCFINLSTFLPGLFWTVLKVTS